MYLFIPDYRFTRSRMVERLKRAESVRRADEARRDGRARSLATVTFLSPTRRQVRPARAVQLRVVK